MAELLLELYSEEIPHGLQISAREELLKNLTKSLEDEGIKFKSSEVYSTPTRIALIIKDLHSASANSKFLSNVSVLACSKL